MGQNPRQPIMLTPHEPRTPAAARARFVIPVAACVFIIAGATLGARTAQWSTTGTAVTTQRGAQVTAPDGSGVPRSTPTVPGMWNTPAPELDAMDPFAPAQPHVVVPTVPGRPGGGSAPSASNTVTDAGPSKLKPTSRPTAPTPPADPGNRPAPTGTVRPTPQPAPGGAPGPKPTTPVEPTRTPVPEPTKTAAPIPVPTSFPTITPQPTAAPGSAPVPAPGG